MRLLQKMPEPLLKLEKVFVLDRSKDKADIADFFSNGGTMQQLEEMIEGLQLYRKRD